MARAFRGGWVLVAGIVGCAAGPKEARPPVAEAAPAPVPTPVAAPGAAEPVASAAPTAPRAPAWAVQARPGCAVGQAPVRSSYALAMNTARSKAREQIARVLATERQEVTTEEVKVAPGGEPLETKRTKREDLAGFGETNVTQVDELDGVLWVEVCSGPATAPLVPR